MKKKSFNLLMSLLLILSMVCGCSNNASQTSVSTDGNDLSSNSIDLNNGSNEANSKISLDSKLIELYHSSKETQKDNEERGVWGEDDAKFDSEGRLWVKKSEVGDITRETHEMSIDYTCSIYKSEKDYTVYCKHETTNMNTDLIVSTEFNKYEYVDNNFDKIDITSSDFEKIQNEFENMNDCYDELTSSKMDKSNDSSLKVDLEIKTIDNYDGNTTVDEMDTVFFGSYEQEIHQDKKPIEWIALDKEGDKILLLSKYILDCNYYNDEEKDITWENSTIRDWLNNNFYNSTFDSIEKSHIVNTYVTNNDNMQFGTHGGNNTYDNVFLLSMDEVNKYFNQSDMWSYNKKLATRGTDYAKGVYIQYNPDEKIRGGEWYSDNNNFFLRSPGVIQSIGEGVFFHGSLDGDESKDGVVGRFSGIRPAIWVKSEYLKNKINQKIFYYFTDNETTLHFSSKKPTSPNYVDGQYNWGDLYDKYMGEGPKSNSLNEFNAKKEKILKVVFDNKIIPNSLKNWFNGCKNLMEVDLANLNTSRVEDMGGLFAFCENLLEIDISGFDFSNIKSQLTKIGPNKYALYPGTIGMFNGCSSLKTIYSSQDIQVNGNFDSTVMFYDCYNLVGGNGTKFNDTFNDISFAVVDSDSQIGYFTYDKSKYYWKDNKYYINGNLQRNKWVTDIENKYYLDNNGSPLKNQWKDGKYLGGDGKMLKNTYTPDNKYVNKDGNVVDLEEDFANINKDTITLNAWYRTDNGVWYYFEGDRDTLKKGWFTDPQDSQTYYLDPTNGVMLTGWQTIDGNDYYFSTRSASEPNWYYVEDSDIWLSYGKKIKALGSMFRDEETPDGKRVDADGKLIK